MKVEQAMRFAAALPEVTEAPHFDMWSFRVNHKIFATVPSDSSHIHVFLDEEQTAEAVDEDGSAYEELRWGSRLRGVRVNLSKARADRVYALLEAAWRRKAPRRLMSELDGRGRRS